MNDKNKKIFAENLEYQMTKYSLSRNDLVDALDIPYMTLSDWINAKTYPRIDKIDLLAKYFGIEKSKLVDKQETPLKLIQRIEDEPLVVKEELKEAVQIAFNNSKYEYSYKTLKQYIDIYRQENPDVSVKTILNTSTESYFTYVKNIYLTAFKERHGNDAGVFTLIFFENLNSVLQGEIAAYEKFWDFFIQHFLNFAKQDKTVIKEIAKQKTHNSINDISMTFFDDFTGLKIYPTNYLISKEKFNNKINYKEYEKLIDILKQALDQIDNL